MARNPKLTYLKIVLFIIWFICVVLEDQLNYTFPAFAPVRTFIARFLPLLFIILLVIHYRKKHDKPAMPP